MDLESYCRNFTKRAKEGTTNMLRLSIFCFFAIARSALLGAVEGHAEAIAPVEFAASAATHASAQAIDLRRVFGSAPLIYSLLTILSICALTIWIYALISWRERKTMPEEFLTQIHDKIAQRDFAQAKYLCEVDSSAISSIIGSGLAMREQGSGAVFRAIEAEGKRLGLELWQKVSLLNDIAVTAPMLGLLGTVVGIFYGLYDKNRTPESLITVFDGLGVAIGTTVVGLMVAILAMLLHATPKIWATGLMSKMETRVLSLTAAMTKPTSKE